jgi:glycosyltransferase involved in cell wall biosynthesis
MLNSEIFVVIPAYNEGKVVTETLTELEPDGYSIVVVHDGSAIPQIQYFPQSAGSTVWCSRNSNNLRAGAAVQTGTEYAVLKRAKIIVHFDADGQHIPALIDGLVDPIRRGTGDVVQGSRFVNTDDPSLVPGKKRIILKADVCRPWLFTGALLTDTHNGFRALSAEIAQRIRVTENGYAHCTEIWNRFGNLAPV